MPTLESHTREIKEIISAISMKDVNEIKPESNLSDLGLDSLAWLDVLANVEEKFDIQIPDEDLIKVTTVGALINIVESFKKI